MTLDDDFYFDFVLDYAVPGQDKVKLGPAALWDLWWRRRWAELGDDLVGRVAREQGFVIATGQLRQLGVDRDDVRRQIRRRCLWSPMRGVLSPVIVDGDDWIARRRRHAITACAAVLSRPGQVISARSAATVQGVPTVRLPAAPELTAAPPITLGARPAAHLFSAALDPQDVSTWFGAPVTRIERTVLDVARHDRWDGIMAADAALREDLTDRVALAQESRRASGWPGVRQARGILGLASPLAESALESVTRLRLHDAGFPRPELQVEIPDPRRGTLYRVDLLLRRHDLVIEADGKGKYTDDELWREKKREGRIRQLRGYRTERVTWGDLTQDWPDTEARLWTACS